MTAVILKPWRTEKMIQLNWWQIGWSKKTKLSFLTKLISLKELQKHHVFFFNHSPLLIDSLIFVLNDLSAKPLQSLWWDLSYCNQRVEVLLRIFIVIPLASNTNSDPPWNTSDSPAPDELVQLHVHSDILCSHCFLCKLTDLFDSIRGLLLECAINKTPIYSQAVRSQHNLYLNGH